jgi:pyruvate dehydrogenase E1 component
MTEDLDPVETREWLDSLDGVIEVEGPQRAHYLLEKLIGGARRRGAPVSYSATTPYLNTIPVEKQPVPVGNQIRTLVMGAIRRGPAAKECDRPPGQTS